MEESDAFCGTLLDSAQYASLVHTGAVSAQPLEIPIDVYGIVQRANEISAIAQVHMRRDEQRMRKCQQQMSQRHGAPQRHGAHRRPKEARKKHKQQAQEQGLAQAQAYSQLLVLPSHGQPRQEPRGGPQVGFYADKHVTPRLARQRRA